MTLGKKQNKELKAKIKAVKRRVRKSKKVKSLKQKAFGLDQMLSDFVEKYLLPNPNK